MYFYTRHTVDCATRIGCPRSTENILSWWLRTLPLKWRVDGENNGKITVNGGVLSNGLETIALWSGASGTFSRPRKSGKFQFWEVVFAGMSYGMYNLAVLWKRGVSSLGVWWPSLTILGLPRILFERVYWFEVSLEMKVWDEVESWVCKLSLGLKVFYRKLF